MTTSADAVCFRFSRRAMATVFEVVLPCGGPAAQRAAEAALDVIDRLEGQLTVYRTSSEVSRLNRIAAAAPVPLEAKLFELLTVCDGISRATGGAFDVTAGPLIKAWGFFRRAGRVPDAAELADVRCRVGYRHLQFDPNRRSVRFTRPGLEINLGSIGKGFALDAASERLSRAGIADALLSGGNSSVLAVGDRTWEVGLQHPQARRRLGVVRLRGRALGVSGATHQSFRYNGRTYGHVLDPRSGEPAVGVALAAALAPTAAEADALATAFYVLGAEGTRSYCAANPHVSAVVLPDGAGDEPLRFNMKATEWEAAQAGDGYPDEPSWDEA
jgi:thiamine biosynthesis lipoprotein